MSSTHSSLKSHTSSPLESISENTTSSSGAIEALPPSAYAYASAAKSLHSSSSVKSHHGSSKSHSESSKKKKDKSKTKKTMTPEEQMAMLLQFKAEKDLE
jgi:hypothetical protein